MLNYVEGYARRRDKVKLNFFETAYGSSREVKYLLFLAREKNWINLEMYNEAFGLADQASAMLWSMIVGTEAKINK